ncbi:MAG: hypothetical protein LUF92_14720 [Clostridiales bacterium]|nr:hypothetical protein [Clostridiales bacterium]
MYTANDGHKQEVLQSERIRLPKRILSLLFGEFCEILVLTPGKSVEGIEIKEVRGECHE